MESVVDINLTLLVQMVHFVVAYFLLRTFLWKPIIDRLQAEEYHRVTLDNELNKQRVIVEQKEFDLLGVQKQAQQAFLLRVPQLISKVVTQKRPLSDKLQVPVLEISQEQMDRMAQVVVEKVVQ